MTDYKLEAAKAALNLIKPRQTIGVGAGTTVAHLVALISGHNELWPTLVLTSSSFKTTLLLQQYGLKVQPPALLKQLDIYFDGCDQFDTELNALKSGGGIHTTEKILAAMAREFILIGDEDKFSKKLDTTYPLVVEILPQALQFVLARLATEFPEAKITLRMASQKDGALISDNGNMLADIYFAHPVAPEKLNVQVKMTPGIVEHSLFYRMASRALVAGKTGIKTVMPVY